MENNNNNFQNIKLGGLWQAKSKKGELYLQGDITINGVNTKIIIFKNKKPQSDNSPNYLIYEKQPLKK